jgi:26S proteasome regulatory subunit N1
MTPADPKYSYLVQCLFADILSVLAMTYSDTQPRGTLRYRLLSAPLRPSDSSLSDPGTWGHEYVRHLAAELGEEFTVREEQSLPESASKEEVEPKAPPPPGTIDDLRDLARQCAKFLLSHNAEPDAVDLLEEMEIIGDIGDLVDENTYGRVCQYMVRYVLSRSFFMHS